MALDALDKMAPMAGAPTRKAYYSQPETRAVELSAGEVHLTVRADRSQLTTRERLWLEDLIAHFGSLRRRAHAHARRVPGR